MQSKAALKNMASHRRRRNKPRRVDMPFDTPATTKPPLGRIIAEFGVLVGWVALWLLNGAATALGFAVVGGLLNSRGVWLSLGRTDWLVIGGVLHILISAIEQHLWRTTYDRPEGLSERVRAFFTQADPLRLALAVVVGAIDSTSTAWYAKRIMDTLFDPLWGWNIGAALLAGAIALSAEPMIRNFARKLRELIREYNQ
jgi:hypothetical protein